MLTVIAFAEKSAAKPASGHMTYASCIRVVCLQTATAVDNTGKICPFDLSRAVFKILSEGAIAGGLHNRVGLFNAGSGARQGAGSLYLNAHKRIPVSSLVSMRYHGEHI